jgi:hypothetical protein
MEIKNGMEVMWRGGFGDDDPKPAVLDGIERTKTTHEKYGTEVPSIHWVNGRWTFPFVCNLTNGHWAYSDQIKPMGV